MARKSGSENRRRNSPLSVRFDDTEKAAIKQMANACGYSVAGYVRYQLFQQEPPRMRPHPHVDHQALTRLYPLLTGLKAEAGKHGSNVNQVAHHVNALAISNGPEAVLRLSNSIETTLEEIQTFYERDIAEMRLLWMKAMGYERGEPEDD